MGGKQDENSQHKIPLWKIFVICTFSAFCNILLNFLVNGFTRIPLYLDTVFTAAVCFSIGLLPGIITGVIYPAVLMPLKYMYLFNFPVETSRPVYFFLICALAEIILICFFHKKIKPTETVFLDNLAERKSPLQSFMPMATQLLTLTAITCVIVSIIGGIIGFALSLSSMPRAMYPEDTFLLGLLRTNTPLLASAILSRIPINIVDRFIVIFAGYGISLLYRKWLCLNYNGSRQKKEK